MNPLQNALRLLILVAAFFLLALIVWLFYCNCRRGAFQPNDPVGQPVHYASAPPHRAEGGKYPAGKPKVREADMNAELPYPVPNGPIRGTLAPSVSSSQLLELKKKKEDFIRHLLSDEQS